MKRLVAALVLLGFCVSLGLFSFFYVKNCCSSVMAGLDNVTDNALTQNKEAVNLYAVQTNEYWKSKIFLLNILIGQQCTNDITKALNQVVFYSENSEFNSVIVHAVECREDLRLIILSNEPDLSRVL